MAPIADPRGQRGPFRPRSGGPSRRVPEPSERTSMTKDAKELRRANALATSGGFADDPPYEPRRFPTRPGVVAAAAIRFVGLTAWLAATLNIWQDEWYLGPSPLRAPSTRFQLSLPSRSGCMRWHYCYRPRSSPASSRPSSTWGAKRRDRITFRSSPSPPFTRNTSALRCSLAASSHCSFSVDGARCAVAPGRHVRSRARAALAKSW